MAALLKAPITWVILVLTVIAGATDGPAAALMALVAGGALIFFLVQPWRKSDIPRSTNRP